VKLFEPRPVYKQPKNLGAQKLQDLGFSHHGVSNITRVFKGVKRVKGKRVERVKERVGIACIT
jgi:hypothetical protein